MKTSEKKINIAIDGHSSCGKSTLARDLANLLGYTYIDSGAMYRSVALYFIRHKTNMQDLPALTEALNNIDIDIRYPEGKFAIFMNDEDVTREIIKPTVTAIVSEVAAISEIRKMLVKIQQRLGRKKGVVMDGRDIGTVVFPDAEVKLFITADTEIRTMRRYKELVEKNISIPFEEVKVNLIHRDKIDSTREDSPLLRADDAVLIDNSYMDREEQLSVAKKIVEEKLR